LMWAERRVAFIVEKHHEAFARWKERVRRGRRVRSSSALRNSSLFEKSGE
jgi:hypothetical protein